jgi:hypothetical protein
MKEKQCECIKCRFIREMFNTLPDYIEEFYPKGEAEDRGEATVKITEFIIYQAKKNRVSLAPLAQSPRDN